VIAVVLRLVAPGRVSVAWVGIVVAAVGAVYFVHPARVTWDGEQWVRQPDADRLLSQRLLAGVAVLIGLGAVVVAALNVGTF
jgi:NADH:ubiquinone oxidoreductase subunit 2 (subunit N)